MSVSIGNGVDLGNLVTSQTNPVTGGIEKLLAAGVDLAAITPAEKSALMVHPRYHCHISAAAAFSDSLGVPDISGNERHGIAESALTTAILGGASGYLTTGVADNQMIDLPDFNFDWNAGERLFIWWNHKISPAASNKSIFGHVASSGAGPGVRLTATTTGDLSVALFNAAGTVATGTSSVSGCFDATLRSFGIFLDGTEKTFSGWKDEILIRNKIAWTLNESTATAVNPRIGGTAASATPNIATATRALVIIKFSATDPAPTIAQLTAAQIRLRKNPSKLLSKADLWG